MSTGATVSRPPEVQGFFDPKTGTISYVLADPVSRECAIIDPVLDFDLGSGNTELLSDLRLIEHVERQQLQLRWILETHAHADHLSGAQLIKEALGGEIVIGEHIREVQQDFRDLLGFPADFPCDGSHFDRLVADQEELRLGELCIKVLHTPGHTPACVSYLVGDAVFVGDTLFMPDYGTARADFHGGDPYRLYRSIQRLLALPGQTRMYCCHDYPPNDRDPAWQTTVHDQAERNIQVHRGITETEFVALRRARDRRLPAPRLIWPSLQVNLRAGQLPPPAANGVSYLNIPLNQFAPG